MRRLPGIGWGGRACFTGRSSLLLMGCLCAFVYVAVVQPYIFHSTSSLSSSSSSSKPQFETLSHTEADPTDGSSSSSSSKSSSAVHTDDCLDGDTLLLLPTAPPTYLNASSATAAGSPRPRPIPLLATNLDYDTEGFLARLLEGWSDAKARHKLVVAGGCDPSVIEAVEFVRREHPDVAVFREREMLGCAPGWNKALDYMLYHEDVEWCLVFNTDMYVPPGALDKLAEEIWEEYDRDPGFCRGVFNVTAGPDAVVFAITRRGMQVLGSFDENIYPAYYEDHEMDLRHNRSQGMCTTPPTRFMTASLHHGRSNNSEYKSGTSILRDRLNDEKKAQRSNLQAKKRERDLANRLDRGFKSSKMYVSAKWGCDSEQENCVFAHPFNNERHALSYWKLDWGRRECILKEERRVKACEYTLEKPVGEEEKDRRRRMGVRGWWLGR